MSQLGDFLGFADDELDMTQEGICKEYLGGADARDIALRWQLPVPVVQRAIRKYAKRVREAMSSTSDYDD